MKKIIILFYIFIAAGLFSQEIPEGITYIKTSDKENMAAAKNLQKSFFSVSKKVFPKVVLCGPFLWKEIRSKKLFDDTTCVPVIFGVPVNGKVKRLEGKGIRWEDQTALFQNYLRTLFTKREKYIIRKLNPWEMFTYWAMISYDIEEPVFMIEGPGVLLLIDCDDNGEPFFIDNYSNIPENPYE